ncbi:MAG: acetoacetate--CoA ligase [Candidatus Kapabacteria bacterium]|nr:acetoacetate--CoA ligase [Ignavibacteriota bacterium]MCW5885444.1 acetoacetate--CoA ligase [Candidatus Kapabacteria bacterium]
MQKFPLWTPNSANIENSNINKFRIYVNEKYKIDLQNYSELYDWSVIYIANFWQCCWDFFDIIHSKRFDTVLSLKDNDKSPDDITNYEWFKGAKLNFAENLLRFSDDEPAIIHYSENSESRRLTYKELYLQVAKLAKALRICGIKKGDRVAGYITNCPEAVIAMLATTSIGAVWTSTSPDFGTQGVLDRFSQVAPKVLIAVDGYYYGGKKFESLQVVKQIQNSINSIEKIVIVEQIGSNIPKDNLYISYKNFTNNDAEDIYFEQTDFNHPVYIMYSSGTTGVPKCIVHGAGGTLIQHLKELILHTNLTDLDTIFYFTTCGWMMWNWLVSSLSTGATLFLFDGSPAYPDISRLWKAVEDERISIFGTSPKYLSSCQKAGIVPKDNFNLDSLKVLLSTGSPLSSENFRWVYDNVKSDLQLSSISGGTDIISCFMLGNPTLPVFSDEIQCRGLGMKVEAFDEDANPVLVRKGELVCTAPFPSMPVYFWDDDDNQKYYSAYFDVYQGIWRHGDYIKITEHGGVIVYGRSDATLNPGGVRIGTAEIYRIVEAMDEIQDSVVIGYPKENDVSVILFIVTKVNFKLDKDLENKIRSVIKSELTPRHVPEQIFSVNEIPHTLNGKKVEIAVLKTLLGEDVKNKASLMNPDSLKQFEYIKILS